MPSAIIAGGGLAGLAAAAALGGAGFDVQLFEARPFLGGRATSYPAPGAGGTELIDNCQHVLMACFANLLDFYERLGVRDRIRFYHDFHFVEPGGRMSAFRAGALSFVGLPFLGAGDKLGIMRALASLDREYARRTDLDSITMLDWLREKRQTQRAIQRFWRQVLVSAINEELDRMAARHGFQVFRLAFFSARHASDMGLSAVPLGELYSAGLWARLPNVRIRLRTAVEQFIEGGAVVQGETVAADYCVCAVPFYRAAALAPALKLDVSAFEHSPITGIHLWFDRPVMDLPHATLLDRTIHWAFNKGEGRYVQLVVSASRSLLGKSRGEVIALALRELAEFFPEVAGARLEKAHVVKEARATFSARPGLETARPPAHTAIPNLFLAGDWTRTGWPATMEGAVRSGYLAAEAVAKAAGRPRRFLV
jgi:squalene-associated FAD-dependent desaturase